MTDFNFYLTNEVYAETFYQLPKIFFTNKKYKKMSLAAKVAYAVLKDRFNYSIKNNWVDEQNRIFFVYTNKELGDILNCSNKTVVKIKKELEDNSLLLQENVGVNTPNKLFIGKPVADAQDVYLQQNTTQTLDTKGSVKSTLQHEVQETLDSKEFSDLETPGKQRQTLGTKGSVKSTHNLYKDKDLDTLDTLDTEKEQIRQKILLDQFAKVQTQTFLNEPSLHLISVFSDTIQEAHAMVGTIQRAKAAVEKEFETVVIAEDHELEIETCLRRVLHKIKTDATVRSPEALMFTSFKNEFTNCTLQKNANKQRLEKDSKTSLIAVYDWVTEK